jgi:hypothetical protein
MVNLRPSHAKRRSRKPYRVADEVRRRNLSRKERKVRKVLIEMTFVAEASKNSFSQPETTTPLVRGHSVLLVTAVYGIEIVP